MKDLNLPTRYEPTGDEHEGGQAYVLICEDTYLERKVAIKFYKNISDLDEFGREVAALLAVNSPHLPLIYDQIVDDSSTPGLVEEFVDGDRLTDIGQISECGIFLSMLHQIAQGLVAIHSAEIIHRDIKPENLKCDSEKILKILDFGLAQSETNAETVARRATRGYAAPEYFSPAPFVPTQAVDVYAFGATAWYLVQKGLPEYLTCIPPHSKGAKPDFDQLGLGLPDEIGRVLNATLESNPEARPRMLDIEELTKKYLLRGKHQAEMVAGHKVYGISQAGRSARVKSGNNRVEIFYDDHKFIVREVTGSVWINNIPAQVNKNLPNSCVLTLGEQEGAGARMFVPFSVSHPQVVL